MKRIKQVIANLFGKKKKEVEIPENMNLVHIDEGSQPHMLNHHMAVNSMTHGETVNADLSRVGLRKMEDGSMVMFFCHMQGMSVKQKISTGDGGQLPDQVTVHDLLIPKEITHGYFNLKNVKVTSNGTMQVLATAKTEWERV